MDSVVDLQSTWITQVPLLLLDTRLAHGSLIAGCEECMDPAGTGSFYNEGEADIVMEHIRALLSAGMCTESLRYFNLWLVAEVNFHI